MYSTHPIVSHQLVQDRVHELQRIAGHTRVRREAKHRNLRHRRRP
jgi:hypothetical protein